MRQRLPRLAAVGLALAGVLLLGGCNELDQEELTRDVGVIQSVAAEGALLADQVAEGRTISSFARVHANELAGTADQTAQGLSDAEVSSSKEADVKAAIALADDESGALGHLVVSPSEEGTAARIGSYLRRIARRATRLEDSL
jgi:hypothetical protein